MDVIITYGKEILLNSWSMLSLMAPYLLLGFFAGGVLSVLVSPRLVEEHLGGHGLWPVLKASAFGVPLPLCSCSVLPVSASLRRHGASRGAVTAFLISTPQTGLDNIFVTLSLLGPVFAVFTPIVTFLSGVVGGVLVDIFEPHGESDVKVIEKCVRGCCRVEPESRGGKIQRMFRHAFYELPVDIGRALMVGILIAGAISTFMPDDFFISMGLTGLTAILVLMLCGIPIYVCATASIPIAFALIEKGASPGAALAFLMTGPASNAAGLSTIWKLLGPRTAFIYLGSIALTAIGAALALDGIFPNLELPVAKSGHSGHEFMPHWLQITFAVLLILMLIPSFLPLRKHAGHEHDTPEK